LTHHLPRQLFARWRITGPETVRDEWHTRRVNVQLYSNQRFTRDSTHYSSGLHVRVRSNGGLCEDVETMELHGAVEAPKSEKKS